MQEIINSDDLKYLILSIAKNKCFSNLDKDDLLQAGYTGALKAVKNYSQSMNTSFSTYAYNYIRGEMCELINKSRTIKVSKEYLKLYKQIEIARNKLSQQLCRIPTNKELSIYLETPEEVINEICIKCSYTLNSTSLDQENDNLDDFSLYNVIGKSYDYDTKIMMNDALDNLSDLEKQIIIYRYYRDYTQQEIARMLGIKQVKVSRIETKSKKKIKEYLCA